MYVGIRANRAGMVLGSDDVKLICPRKVVGAIATHEMEVGTQDEPSSFESE